MYGTWTALRQLLALENPFFILPDVLGPQHVYLRILTPLLNKKHPDPAQCPHAPLHRTQM